MVWYGDSPETSNNKKLLEIHKIDQSYLITGLDCGLDCWTGLMDWTTGLNSFISHNFHSIKCHKFGYSIAALL